jgi:hypothetical protein
VSRPKIERPAPTPNIEHPVPVPGRTDRTTVAESAGTVRVPTTVTRRERAELPEAVERSRSTTGGTGPATRPDKPVATVPQRPVGTQEQSTGNVERAPEGRVRLPVASTRTIPVERVPETPRVNRPETAPRQAPTRVQPSTQGQPAPAPVVRQPAIQWKGPQTTDGNVGSRAEPRIQARPIQPQVQAPSRTPTTTRSVEVPRYAPTPVQIPSQQALSMLLLRDHRHLQQLRRLLHRRGLNTVRRSKPLRARRIPRPAIVLRECKRLAPRRRTRDLHRPLARQHKPRHLHLLRAQFRLRHPRLASMQEAVAAEAPRASVIAEFEVWGF